MRNGQNLPGTLTLGMLGRAVAAGGGAGEGAAPKPGPRASRLKGRETGGNENVFVEEAARLGRHKDCSWQTELRKSFQAGEKARRWESGREIFREAFDLAGEECSSHRDG